MFLPDIWGQGALFACSGASCTKTSSGAIEARLCSDSFALRFLSDNVCTLKISAENTEDVIFNTVMTDYIHATVKTGSGETDVRIMFVAMDTVLICADSDIGITPVFENEITQKKNKTCTVYSDSHETFALGVRNSDDGALTAAFSYGKKAADRVKEALLANPYEQEERITAFYASLPEFRIPNEQIEKLYYRCASVLSASVFSAEGIIKSGYIAVEADGKKSLQPFYSSICTLGLRHILPDLAKDTLESILASVAADGMLSSHITPTGKSEDLCPPTLAWCFWELYTVNGDRAMLENAYATLKKYLHYIIETRDINKNHLFEWQISGEGEPGRESAMDNSPRFDDGVILDCVDFSCYTANEAKYMKLIADEIDKHGEALYWGVMYERIKNAVNEHLFDEDDKTYYDKAVVSNMFKKIKTSVSFLPLFAGICENRHAMALLKLLNNEDKFNLKYGIPSVSRDSEEYSDDMFRGPMHIVTNYMIAKGLESYVMHDKANEIKSRYLERVISEYYADGVLYEFYSADGTKSAGNLSKKGCSTNFTLCRSIVNQRDFAPTAAIIIDMLLSRSKKLPSGKY